MVLLLGFKLPSGDTSEHSIALELLKPNGDRTAIEQPLERCRNLHVSGYT
jgi:hypothetical protein